LLHKNIEKCRFLEIITQMKASRISEWIEECQRHGRYAFSLAELPPARFGSRSNILQGLLRLQRKNRVRRLRREFFVILPVEYARIGMIPVDWFIDDLMTYLDHPYYVGLFSAAALHGASHQQVQVFQVVTPVLLKHIEVAGLKLRFIQKKHFTDTPTQTVKGHTGLLPVSTPAATVLDLVSYANRIGGLDAILTPLMELGETLQLEDLLKSARHEANLSVVQRTGWLLELLGEQALADGLAAALADRLGGSSRVPLDPAAHRQGSGDNRWRVIVNAQPEGDA
jgi:predicted transcriptional regulator of viral defense system